MNKSLSKRTIASLILAAAAALLFWSELIFSNVPSLVDVAVPAAALGWTTASTRLYFTVLVVLDIIGGAGALLYIGFVLKRGSAQRINRVLWLTAVTLIVYGSYQFVTAFRLPADLRLLYWVIGVVYLLLGLSLRLLYRPQA